ncbi:uncharacterized protein LOC135394369 [Ornithodoros turicata]|uniref:uncharacterized protein LOC135394369 n=1 Tax=Ornithodoros turicata TaxID=34597 RepID=UPI00313A0511
MGHDKWQLMVETPTKAVPVVKFSNGCLRQTHEMPVRVYKRKSSAEKSCVSHKVFVASTDHVDYVGEYHRNNSLVQQLLAIEDGKYVRLYPAELVTLAPYIQRPESRTKAKEGDSYRGQVDALASAFGSKRKRRAVESRLRLEVQESNLQLSASATLGEIQESAVLKETVEETSTVSAIPPQNKNAVIPQDVYPIEAIVQADDHPYLDQLATPLLSAGAEEIEQWRADATYSDYVLQRVLRMSKDPENRELESRLLVYYQLLVNLSRMRPKDFLRKDPMPNVEEPIKQKLLNTFTLSARNEQGICKRTFPDRLRDKVFAYLLVLVLILEDYKADLQLVQPDTKASTSRLVNIGYALGCHVGTHRLPGSHISTKYLELKLPLHNGLRPKKMRK